MGFSFESNDGGRYKGNIRANQIISYFDESFKENEKVTCWSEWTE